MRKLKTKSGGTAAAPPQITEGKPGIGAFRLYFPSTKETAGNILALIALRHRGCSRDRLLDILALASVRAATESGLCLLCVPFEVWATGLVPKDLFVDLSLGEPVLMHGYLRRGGGDLFASCLPEGDIRLPEDKRAVLEATLAETEHLSDEQVHALATGPGTIWEKEAARVKAGQAFARRIVLTTEREADFERYLDDETRARYDESFMAEEEAGIYYEEQ